MTFDYELIEKIAASFKKDDKLRDAKADLEKLKQLLKIADSLNLSYDTASDIKSALLSSMATCENTLK